MGVEGVPGELGGVPYTSGGSPLGWRSGELGSVDTGETGTLGFCKDNTYRARFSVETVKRVQGSFVLELGGPPKQLLEGPD